jgi:D-alanyl-lipoteichoic acid acyltransferase DltB (MBOAT superfamily)
LGGNKVSQLINYRNLLIIFLLSGIWHGASWNFILWGALHGLFSVLYLFVKPNLPNTPRLLNLLFTFTIVSLIWIFFRAETFASATDIYRSLLQFDFGHTSKNIITSLGLIKFSFLLFVIILLNVVEYKIASFDDFFKDKSFLFRWSVYFSTVVLIFICAINNLPVQFIYFQF